MLQDIFRTWNALLCKCLNSMAACEFQQNSTSVTHFPLCRLMILFHSFHLFSASMISLSFSEVSWEKFTDPLCRDLLVNSLFSTIHRLCGIPLLQIYITHTHVHFLNNKDNNKQEQSTEHSIQFSCTIFTSKGAVPPRRVCQNNKKSTHTKTISRMRHKVWTHR